MVKLRNIFVLTLLILMISRVPATFALSENDFIKTNSVIGFYLNANLLFRHFVNSFSELEKTGRLEFIKSRLEMVGLPESVATESTPVFISRLEYLQQENIFDLTGGLWATFDENFNPSILLEAKVKPKSFWKFITEHCPADFNLPEPFIEKEENVSFKIPFKGGAGILSVLPEAIVFTDESQQSLVASNSDFRWKFFLEKAGNGGILCAADFNAVKVRNLIEKRDSYKNSLACAANMKACLAAKKMYLNANNKLADLSIKVLKEKGYLKFFPKCPENGNYEIAEDGLFKCSIHGNMMEALRFKADLDQESPDPRIRAFRRVRLAIEAENVLIELNINDKNMREQWLAIIKYQLMVYKQMAQQKLDQLPVNVQGNTKKILDAIKLDVSGEWLRIYAQNIDVIEMINNILDTVVENTKALSNSRSFSLNDPERQSCLAIQSRINNAIEFFEMDHEASIQNLDIDLLVKDNYLKSPAVCPSGGTFFLRKNAQESRVECSKHGY